MSKRRFSSYIIYTRHSCISYYPEIKILFKLKNVLAILMQPQNEST